MRDLFHLAVEFRSRSLVNLGFLRQAQNPHRLQNTKHADGVHISGILRHIKRNLHMALGCQVVDFIRLHQIDDSDQRRRIRQISVMKGNGACLDQMINAGRIGNGCPTGDAMHLIPFLQQKLRQIRTILTSNACNQCNFTHDLNSLSINLVFIVTVPDSASSCQANAWEKLGCSSCPLPSFYGIRFREGISNREESLYNIGFWHKKRKQSQL